MLGFLNGFAIPNSGELPSGVQQGRVSAYAKTVDVPIFPDWDRNVIPRAEDTTRRSQQRGAVVMGMCKEL